MGKTLLGDKQYSSRSGSAGRSGVEEAGGKEGRDEGDVMRLEALEEGRLVKMVNKL